MPMNLPTLGEFQEAIRHPPSAFRSAELQGLRPCLGRSGQPLSWSGAFGIVFRMEGSQGLRAVKVFTTEIRDLVARYGAYQGFLERCPATFRPHLIPTQCLPQGFLAQGRPQPCIVMPWIEGQPLHEWVWENLVQRERLRWLQGQLRKIARSMADTGFCHGDLQHGNLMVTDRALVMVDYDNLRLPGMPPLPSTTNGVPGYRHPRGNAGTSLAEHDRFALLEIFIALETLMRAPGLLSGRMGEDYLLFQAEDLRTPHHSPLFQHMLRDAHLRPWAELLMAVCQQAPERTPELDRLLAKASFPESLPPVTTCQKPSPSVAAGPVLPPVPAAPEPDPLPAAHQAAVQSPVRSDTAYGCGCLALLLVLLLGGALGLRSCLRRGAAPTLHAQLEGELQRQLGFADAMRERLKPLREAPKDTRGNLLQGGIPADLAPQKPKGMSDQDYLMRLATLLEIQAGACAQARALVDLDRKHPDPVALKACLAQIDGLPDDVRCLLSR